MSQTLTAKTLHGVQWTTIATVITSITQIGSMSIMARLLDPSAFGLIALSGVILRFASYFANMGMSQALVQKEELTEENIQAAFTSSILLSFFFYLVIWLAAPFATQMLGNAEVTPIVRISALNFIISGLTSTSTSLLRRRMDFKILVIIEILTYVICYVGIQIILAYMNFGVWSLVFASLAQSLLSGIACYWYVRHNISLLFSWKHYKPLFAFGGRVSFISFLEFLGSNLDTILIGRFTSVGILGIYNRAHMLIKLPMQSITTSVSRVLFPALSSIQNQTERLKNVYLSAISLVGYIIIPGCIGAFVASEQLVLVLLGHKWIEAIPILQILAFGTALSLLSHFGGIVCEAKGILNPKAFLQIFFLILLTSLMYLLKDYGIIGFAYAIVISELFRHIIYIFILKSFLHFTFTELIRSYLPSILTGVIIGISLYAFSEMLNHTRLPQIIKLICEVLLGAGLLILLLFANFNKSIRTQAFERLLNKIVFFQSPFFVRLLK